MLGGIGTGFFVIRVTLSRFARMLIILFVGGKRARRLTRARLFASVSESATEPWSFFFFPRYRSSVLSETNVA